MAKKTIGHFKSAGRKYNIYMYRGYKKYNKWVYIGNVSFGYFMKFDLTNDVIGLYELRYLKSQEYNKPRKALILDLPKRRSDIKELLTALFKPDKLELLDLSLTSRDEIIDEILVDCI